MCSFDLGEVYPVYSITHPRCRKPAPCRVCKKLIAKGEEYERHSYVSDGTAASERMCVGCALAHRAFREDEHHHGAPSPDWFRESLRECFEGADKSEPDVRLWRQLYAGIVRRTRAAKRAS